MKGSLDPMRCRRPSRRLFACFAHDRYDDELQSLNQIGLFLMVSAAVAIACERARIPFTVGLIVAGLLLAVAPVPITIPLSKTLIYTFLLPPLVFEAALRLDWHKLRADLPIITALAIPGLLIAQP